MHVYVCMYMYICMCVCMCVYVCVYVCMYVYQMRKSVSNFGGTDLEKIWESARAEGAKLRLPNARSPSRLGGLGKRRKKPTRFFTFYAKMEYIFGYVNFIFFSNQIEKIIDE